MAIQEQRQHFMGKRKQNEREKRAKNDGSVKAATKAEFLISQS